MARVYDLAVAALAVGVDRKWLDNLIAQHTIPGTDHFSRGVPRRLSMKTLLTAAIVRELNRALGIPVSRAVEISASLLREDSATTLASSAMVRVSGAITLSVDVLSMERNIEQRLLHAMETVVPRRRGRPPANERRGTR